MKLATLALRFRWLQMPTGLLVLLLQRTPLLRVAVQLEGMLSGSTPAIMRSAFAVVAMGAYNSLAGATVFNVTATPVASSPTSGAARSVFAITEASGTAVSVGISVSGAPGNPRSYSVDTLPAGLSLTGGTGTYVNVTAPYKMTIAGTPTTAGTVPVTVTAWDGSNGSGGNSAKITVNFTITGGVTSIAPSITTQPSSQTVTAGGTVSFTVAASGTPTPTYQWQKGGANIAGATSATYSIASVAAGDAGSYAAVATNSAGTATSTAATLTVSAATTAPAITTQPSSQTVAPGGPASFTVAASGTPTPTYQWQKGGANIAGATSATYSIASVVAGDAGSYAAVATNSAGTATSTAATLTVSAATTAPAITTQPSSQTVTAGGTASFSVKASGNPSPTYQWYFGGAAISGATSSTLSLSNVQTANAGDYYASATNTAGSAISSTAKLTVQAPAPVTQVPSQIVMVGHDVAISATGASGAMQWQVSTDNGLTWQNLTDTSTYSGTASSTLEILHVTSALNGYMYRSMLSGGIGATSATTLSVVAGYFTFPTSVGADSSGNLYVSDASAQTIQKISSAGQVTLVAGSAGQSGSTNGSGSTARFNQPGALAAAADGTLSVSDTANDLIRSITASGNVTALAGAAGSNGTADGTGAAARFWSPIGIARDASGGLFVADSRNHTVRRITTGGAVTTFAGSAGAAGSADGTGSSARFNNPAGVAVDSSGNAYVADAANNTIRMITPAGVVSTLAGLAGVQGSQDGTGSGARFNNPGGLAFGSSGELYLADTGNSTIRKILAGGVVTTVAGLAGIPGLMDGTGGYAWFDHPEGLTLGADGNLYVADTGNAMIRKVTLAGSVSTMSLSTGSSTSTSDGTSSATTSSPGTSNASPASSAGAGGGAMAGWFVSFLGLACLLRWRLRKN